MFANVVSGILSVVLLVVCSLIRVNAQDYRPGYIIKNNRDSISGYIAYRSGNKNLYQCLFKTSKRTNPTVYTPAELKTFGFFEDKNFESILLSKSDDFDGPIFAQVIVKGILNLYRVDQFYVAVKDSLVILPTPKNKDVYNTEGHWFKKDKRYVALLNSLIKDCDLSANETSYSEEELTDLIWNYNRCKGLEQPYKKTRPIAKLGFSAFTGFVRSNATMDLHEDVEFSPSHTVIGAMGFDLSSPRVFDRIFLSVEAWYVKSFYQAYQEGPFNGDMRYQDIFLDASYLKIPVGFRYNFLHESNTPYVKAGFSLSVVNDVMVRTVEEKETAAGVIYTNERYDGYVFRSPRSIWIGIGYDKTVIRKLRVFAELRFETGSGFIGTHIQSFSNLTNYNFLAGIRF